MRINEYLLPITEEELEVLKLQIENYPYTRDMLKIPIKDIPSYEEFLQNRPELKERTLWYLIHHFCKKAEYKSFFSKSYHLSNIPISAFISFIEEDDIIRDLMLFYFYNDKELEKSRGIHYLYCLIVELLKTHFKITIELKEKDYKLDCYILNNLHEISSFSQFSRLFNKDKNSWLYIFVRI